MSARARERARLIGNLRRLRAGVAQIFIDVDFWNTNVRKAHEEPIDPDPFGDMRRLLVAIDKLLAEDKGFGPLASLDFERSH